MCAKLPPFHQDLPARSVVVLFKGVSLSVQMYRRILQVRITIWCSIYISCIQMYVSETLLCLCALND